MQLGLRQHQRMNSAATLALRAKPGGAGHAFALGISSAHRIV